MIYWYALTDREIDKIESAIPWFKNNNTKFIDYLYEVFYVAGTNKEIFMTFNKNENNSLNKCYKLKPNMLLPAEVLSALKPLLKPYIIGIH